MTSKSVADLLEDLDRDPLALPTEGVQRQPVDSEAWFKTLKYAPGLPGPVRVPRPGAGVHDRLRDLVQPRPPALRDRPAHPRRRPPRPYPQHTIRAPTHLTTARDRTPATVRHHPTPTQDPRPARTGLDQQKPEATGGTTSRLTPAGLNPLTRSGVRDVTLSGLARNFGDVFELWSGGQCGVGVVVGGDALE